MEAAGWMVWLNVYFPMFTSGTFILRNKRLFLQNVYVCTMYTMKNVHMDIMHEEKNLLNVFGLLVAIK